MNILFHYAGKDKKIIENYKIHFPEWNHEYEIIDFYDIVPGSVTKDVQAERIQKADYAVMFISADFFSNQEVMQQGFQIFQQRQDLFQQKKVFIVRIRSVDDSVFDPNYHTWLFGGKKPKNEDDIVKVVKELKEKINGN